MEKEKLESLLIDYIDGVLSASEREEVENLLSEHKEAQQLYEELKEVIGVMGKGTLVEVPLGHEKRFEDNLKREIESHDSKTLHFRPVIYRAAAAVVLIMLGLAGGYWINKNVQNERELAALRKEMAATKNAMMAMLNNSQSASQRMQGVNVALSIASPDNDVVVALEKAMASDPNTNVRLAALKALGEFSTEPLVRGILIESLATQDDPIVQIALIQLLVSLKEKGVINDLEKIIEDDRSIEAVKDEAYTGIIKLS